MREQQGYTALYRAILLQLKKDILRKGLTKTDRNIKIEALEVVKDTERMLELCKNADIKLEDFMVGLRVDMQLTSRREENS